MYFHTISNSIRLYNIAYSYMNADFFNLKCMHHTYIDIKIGFTCNLFHLHRLYRSITFIYLMRNVQFLFYPSFYFLVLIDKF